MEEHELDITPPAGDGKIYVGGTTFPQENRHVMGVQRDGEMIHSNYNFQPSKLPPCDNIALMNNGVRAATIPVSEYQWALGNGEGSILQNYAQDILNNNLQPQEKSDFKAYADRKIAEGQAKDAARGLPPMPVEEYKDGCNIPVASATLIELETNAPART